MGAPQKCFQLGPTLAKAGPANMYYGNEFSVDVMIDAWERRFVCSSVGRYIIRFAPAE